MSNNLARTKSSPANTFVQIFTLKLCEDPNYPVSLSDKPDENGGIEVSVVFTYDTSEGSGEMFLDLSNLKQEFPHGVTITQMTEPTWISHKRGHISLMCSTYPEKKVEPVKEDAVSHNYRVLYTQLRDNALTLPQWDDLSISKQKVIKGHLDMLFMIAKM